MSIQFPPELVPGFKMQVGAAGPFVSARCSGMLDAQEALSVLQPELLRFHQALIADRIASVKLEMQDVEYMSSSGIKCFMAWFLKAEQNKGHRYAIEISYDPDRTWQYISFTTMGRIAPNVLKMHAQQKAKAQ